jgi:hypothetical protein
MKQLTQSIMGAIDMRLGEGELDWGNGLFIKAGIITI